MGYRLVRPQVPAMHIHACMPPRDSDEWGSPEGAEDEAAE